MKILLLIFIIMFCIATVELIEKIVIKISKKTEEKYNLRQAERKEKRYVKGNYKEKGIINNIDKLINTSNIRKYLPFLNAEIYLLFNILIFFAAYILGSRINSLIGIIIALGAVITLYIILKVLENYFYRKIDQNISILMDTMYNFSATENDIVELFSKSSNFIQEPLRGYIKEFCTLAKNTGDVDKAFEELQSKIKNKNISSLLRNLKSCSERESDYRNVINDSRIVISEYLQYSSKRDEIVKSGRKEILLIIAIAMLMVKMFMSLVPNLFLLLQTNLTGNIISIFVIAVLVGTILNYFTLNKKE